MSRFILLLVILMSAFGMAATSMAADDNTTCTKSSGDEAISACSRLITKNQKNIQAYLNRGLAYTHKGENDRAIADFDVVARFAPNEAVVYYNRSHAYYNKGDFDRAIADDDQAIRLNPTLVWAYSDRGIAYEGKGYHDRAIVDFDQAIRLDPQYAFAYSNRGISYNSKGEYDRAIADFDEAIRLKPDYALAYNGRAAAYLNKREYDRAIGDFDQAIRLDPKFAAAYSNRANAYRGMGDYDRAIADADQAISVNPTYARAYINRGAAYGHKGDHERAIADANQAIRLNPKYANFYTIRSDIYNHKGDYDRAIADADEAIRVDPKNASAYNNRGEAYEAKNDPDHAIADFDQALKLDPGLADARRGRERVQVLLAKRSNPGVQATSAAALPAKRALVIGINAYPNLGGAAQLERAAADAEAVGDKLAALGFQVTRLTTASQTTLDAIIHGFDEFQKTVAPNDMVVLFYAGHGMGLPDGTYLVPGDVREASLQVEATAKRATVSENELTDGLRRARAGIVVAVIDACRNDLFSRATQRAMGNERGLRPVETEGIFKLYSASEGQTALDRLPGSDGSRNSVFTRVFLKAIGTPGLDLNRLGAAVRDEVHEIARSADHQQTPAVYDKLIGSTRVYFAGETTAADNRPR
jgi:tetratricopeptide (TPR) repeat protein